VAAGYCDTCWQILQRQEHSSESMADTPATEHEERQDQQI
jgi:hypothetical protein